MDGQHRWFRLLWTLSLSLALAAALAVPSPPLSSPPSHSSFPSSCLQNTLPYRDLLILKRIPGRYLPLLTTNNLEQQNKGIKNLVILIHGYRENITAAFCSGLESLKQRNLTNEIALISPFFYHESISSHLWMNQNSSSSSAPTATVPLSSGSTGTGTGTGTASSTPLQSLYWKRNASWMSGADSSDVGMEYIAHSSFDLLDDLYLIVTQRGLFPSLERVTMIGFSAGAQLLNRYAWATTMDTHLDPLHSSRQQIPIRYLISDPSSWLYFDEYRPYTSPTPTPSSAPLSSSPSPSSSHSADSGLSSSLSSDLPSPSSSSCILPYDTGPSHHCHHFIPITSAMKASCPEIDVWRYGLRSLDNSTGDRFQFLQQILSDPTLSSLHTQWYFRKDIRYLLGSYDVCNCFQKDYLNPSHCYETSASPGNTSLTPRSREGCLDTYPDSMKNDLSESCGSQAQGTNRLQRGLNYLSYLQFYLHSSPSLSLSASLSSPSLSSPSSPSAIKSAIIPFLRHDLPAFLSSDIVYQWGYALDSDPSPAVAPSAFPSLFTTDTAVKFGGLLILAVGLGWGLWSLCRYQNQRANYSPIPEIDRSSSLP
jgi:hypothetical protein